MTCNTKRHCIHRKVIQNAYQINALFVTGGNTNSDFEVDSVGLITTANAMDAAKLAGYSLVLEADDGTLTGTTTVWIAVTDCTSGTTSVVIGFNTLLITLVISLY